MHPGFGLILHHDDGDVDDDVDDAASFFLFCSVIEECSVIGIRIQGTDVLWGVGWGNFVCSMLLGYVYPAYECFKIVERKKPELEHLRFWCQYWYYIFNTIKFLCRRYLGFEVSKSVGLICGQSTRDYCITLCHRDYNAPVV